MSQEPQHARDTPMPEAPPETAPPVILPPIGLAVSCLLLGVLGFVTSPILIGMPLALLGILLGIGHLRRHAYLKSMVTVGLLLCGLTLMMGIPIGYSYYGMFREFSEAIQDHDHADFTAWHGTQSPELSLKAIDGQEVNLSAMRGKHVVIDVWATWCPPCRKEIPHFVQLAKENPNDLVIIGISDEDETTLRDFAEKNEVTYPIISAKDLPAPFGEVTSLPTTFFIDRNGVIQQVLEGYHSYEDLRQHALAADHTGQVAASPDTVPDTLKPAESPTGFTLQWEREVEPSALACGDWNGDGADEALLLQEDGTLFVIGQDGTDLASVGLGESKRNLELGRHPDGPRLLRYDSWDSEVTVCDATGATVWNYKAPTGLNGAHWMDLDGDGTDEMTVGFNGGGGVHAVSADGATLWKYRSIGNVWTHACVSAPEGAGRIFATEAGGSIHVLDPTGNRVDSFRPQQKYFDAVFASSMDAEGTMQVLALPSERDAVYACTPNGTTQWITPASGTEEHFDPAVAVGDLDGDTKREWMFLGAENSAIIASADGQTIASLERQDALTHAAILESPGAPGLLLLQSKGTLRAFALALEKEPDPAQR